METNDRIVWVGNRALEIFRGKEIVLSNRLERSGLRPAVVIEIARCVAGAISEFCREHPGLGPVFARAELEVEIFKIRPTTEKTESEQGSDRVRDAILFGGSDPSSPAPIQDSSHSVVSHAATRARIEEGLIGI